MNQKMKEFLKVKEFAEIFDMDPSLVYLGIKMGSIKAIRCSDKPFSHYRIPKTEVLRRCEEFSTKMNSDLINHLLQERLGEKDGMV